MRRRSLLGSVVVLAWALLSAGCLGPPVEGPQIDDIPSGFAFHRRCESSRSPIPALRPMAQRCYINNNNRWGPDVITISHFEGSLGIDDARRAREDTIAKRASCSEHTSYCQRVGELEALTVDGHEGWGFPITTIEHGELSAATYLLVLPYDDDESYGIEVAGSGETLRSIEATRALASRFAVRSARDLRPLQIGVTLMALALGVAVFVWIRRQRAAEPRTEVELVRASFGLAGSREARRPALVDAPLRVEALRRRFSDDPEGTITELERLRESFQPHPALLHLLGLAYLKRGQRAQALTFVQEVWPLLLAKDGFPLAVELFHYLGAEALVLRIPRNDAYRVAESLIERGNWQLASQVYGNQLVADGADRRAASGLMRIAANRVKVAEGSESALALYAFVEEHAQDEVLRARVRSERARLSTPVSRTPVG